METELLVRLVDGQVTPEQAAAANRLLRDSAEAREFYLKLGQDAMALGRCHPCWWRRAGAIAAAVAALLLISTGTPERAPVELAVPEEGEVFLYPYDAFPADSLPVRVELHEGDTRARHVARLFTQSGVSELWSGIVSLEEAPRSG